MCCSLFAACEAQYCKLLIPGWCSHRVEPACLKVPQNCRCDTGMPLISYGPQNPVVLTIDHPWFIFLECFSILGWQKIPQNHRKKKRAKDWKIHRWKSVSGRQQRELVSLKSVGGRKVHSKDKGLTLHRDTSLFTWEWKIDQWWSPCTPVQLGGSEKSLQSLDIQKTEEKIVFFLSAPGACSSSYVDISLI